MLKARFTEHQIIAVLKSVEAGRTVKDVCNDSLFLMRSFLWLYMMPGTVKEINGLKILQVDTSL